MFVSKNAEMKQFGFTMATVIVLLFGLLLPWLFEYRYPLWPWIVSSAFLLIALLAPALLAPIHAGWMRFGHALGWINSRIVLGLVYYSVFIFVAVMMKLLGKDPMSRKFDSELESYRIPSEVRTRDHLERPF